jgi:predicted MFS family arabinose efflux permease
MHPFRRPGIVRPGLPSIPIRRRRRRRPAGEPASHRPAARLTGILYGTLQLGALFPVFVITVLAAEIGASEDIVQLVLGTTAAGGALVTGYWLRRRVTRPSGPRLAVSVLALAVALLALGLRPSVWTFAVALGLGAALGPSAMLARHTVARQFPGREGDFLGVSQTWTYLARALGGLAFALAVFGVLDLRWATIALGGAAVAVAGAYAWWPRLRRGASSDQGEAPGGEGEAPEAEPTPLGRLLGSPSLRKGLVATTGIYAAFQLFWAELQPRVAELGFSDRAAAVITALFALTVVLSIPWVRKHSTLSDEDATRSATEASFLLCIAAAFGLVSIVPGLAPVALVVVVLGAYTAAIDIGGNATSSAVTTALSLLDARAVLMSALARSLAATLGGLIAGLVGWTGAVWAILGFALATLVALRRWELHPTEEQAWIEGSCDPLRITLAPPASEDEAGTPARFTVGLESAAGRIGPWAIWRRDTLEAKTPLKPEVPRSERVLVFRLRFDWPLADRRPVRRRSGRLYPGAGVPLALGGKRRGTLRWHLWSLGRWRIEEETLVLQARSLGAAMQVVHHRHGPI